MRREDITQLEEMNFNAWPALKQARLDGWLLRYAGGESRRVNSVNVLRPSSRPFAEKIEDAEAIYRRWGRPCIFRLTPLAEPEIDPLLIARGYTLETPTFLQVARTPELVMPAGVTILDEPNAWLDAALDIRGLKGDEAEVFRAQHRAVRVPFAWMLIREGGEAIACGCSSVERGWSGLLGIYVRNDARRRGLAWRVSEALLSWGYAQGARQTWLQVEQANAPALPLYASLGFRTAYEYHHRQQRPGT
jgi:GNAT superfamily N-acetyltransferase